MLVSRSGLSGIFTSAFVYIPEDKFIWNIVVAGLFQLDPAATLGQRRYCAPTLVVLIVPSFTAFFVMGVLGPALSLLVLLGVAFSVVGAAIVLVLWGRRGLGLSMCDTGTLVT